MALDPSYRSRLIREAVEDPSKLLTREKFWRLELWPFYLRRCDDLVYGDPHAGLAFSRPAPEYAARIAAAHPEANGADLLLLGHSYFGSALRRTDDYPGATEEYRAARRHKDGASPKALAEHLRRYAYLHAYQKDPLCFAIIEEALTIHRQGNLVDRHAFGECLICRAFAYVTFGHHGRSFDDYTAALNHVSLKIDNKPYHCVLHCLCNWAVDFGTDEELEIAYANLKPALSKLNNCWGLPYPKLKLRWLIALIEVRLGHWARGEEVLLEVRKGLVKMELAYEVGMVSIDLASLYRDQGRHAEVQALAGETAALFRRIGVERRAQEALDLWRQAEKVDAELLKDVRGVFMSHADPIPAMAA